MLSIQTNVNSLIAQQNLNVNNEFQAKTIQQLTSGYRINSSGDDAAGLSVANSYRSSVAELTQGVANGNDGVAQLQIMDGGMSNISQILDRLKTLATQSASGTLSGGDATRITLNSEFQTDLQEIDRQSQSIGLNTNGDFAKSLDVYLGQGSGSQSLQNGIVTLDLANSAVDSQALGMKGMQSVGNLSNSIGPTSATSVQNIVTNTGGANNNQEATTGYALFQFSGAGFSDGGKAQVSVNLQGVTDAGTLVTAINNAIQKTGQGNTAAATAFANANIVASVNVDSNGGQELAFTSATSAFQVQAGDQMGNALMGNVSIVGASPGVAGVAQGTAVSGTAATTVTGLATQSGNFGSTQDVSLVVSGGGLASPVTLNLNTGASGVNTTGAINDLETQFAGNSQLEAAGLSMSGSSVVGNQLSFQSASGQAFNIQVTGDTQNLLGLGSFLTNGSGASSYGTLTATSAYSIATSTGGPQVAAGLEVSLDGQASLTPVTVDLTAGPSATVASSPGGAIGASAVDVTAANNNLNITVTNNGVANQQIFSLATTAQVATAGTETSSLLDSAYAASTVITAAKHNNQFQISFDGGPATTLTIADGTYTSKDDFLTAVNTALSTAPGGAIAATATWGTTGSDTGALTIATTAKGSAASVAFSQQLYSTKAALGSGTLTDSNYAASTVISAANHNNQFNLSVDGGTSQLITIADGTYTAASDFLAALTTALSGKGVSATWGAVGGPGTGALTLTSTGGATGLGSSVSTSQVQYNSKASIAAGSLTSANYAASTVISAASHNNTFNLSVDGGAAQLVTIADGTYTAASDFLGAVNSALSGKNVQATWGAVGGAGTGALTLTSTGATSGTGASLELGQTTYSTKAALTGGTLTSSNYVGSTKVTAGSNDEFNISVDGGPAATVTIGAGTYTAASDFLEAINGALSAANVTNVTAYWGPIGGPGTGALTFTSTGTNSGLASSVSIGQTLTNTGSALLGYGEGASAQGQVLDNTGIAKIGETDGTIGHGLNNQNNTGVTAVGMTNGQIANGSATAANGGFALLGLNTTLGRGQDDAPTTLQSIAAQIQTQFNGAATVTVSNTNQLIIASTAKGANSSVAIGTPATNGANTLLHLTPGTVSGTNASLTDVVNSLNAQFATGAYQAAGLTASATDSAGGNTGSNYLTISSNNGTQFRLNTLGGTATETKGAAQSTVTSSNIVSAPITVTEGVNDQFNVAVDGNAPVTLTVGPGVYNTAAGFVNAVNAAITNAGLSASLHAGWGSSGTGNALIISDTSANLGTSSTLALSGVTGNTGLAAMGLTAATTTGHQTAENLGFGVAGISFAGGVPSSTGTAMSTQLANGVSNTTAVNFKALQFATDKQALTFSALDATGQLETKTITLENSTAAGGNTAGASIDSAIAYINQQLQATTNMPALQQIVAVKQANTGNTAEQISFMSNLSGFTVGVAASANGTDGLNSGAATQLKSGQNGTTATMSIGTQATAEQAITAITKAVSSLGSAQAAVGKGENQLGYALNLAQSQITNFSAAESQIRDADVAQQAANLSKAQVLQQSSIAAMAQANSAPQAVLSLLKG